MENLSLTENLEIAADWGASASVEKPVKKVGFKDFSISDTALFTIFSDEDKEKILLAKKGKGGENKVENAAGDTEKSPLVPPFVAAAIQESQKSLTENMSPTFNTAGDPRIDFFFHVLEKTSEQQTKLLLERSWDKNALHTLKLVGILRDIRGGKGIRKQYQDCLYWLYLNHPKTLYENLEELLQLGYWKDCLEMLMVIMFGGFVHPFLSGDDVGKSNTEKSGSRKRSPKNGKTTDIHYEDKERYNKLITDHYKEKNSGDKNQINVLRIKFAKEKFQTDPKYRLFHVRIAQIFAKQLKTDLENTKTKNDVSLAAKWAPSIEAHFDRYTLIASTIAVELVKILPEKSDILLKSVPLAVYLSRRVYHKEYCVPLRKHHQIPEVAMSAGKWNEVNYKRVSSKCMKRNKKSFIEHDKERFEEFLIKPESKVAGATLKPVEIFHEAMNLTEATAQEEKIVIEKQWISLVEDIKKKGGALLKNAVAICDVSGSMAGQPMEAALGLTLITMSLSDKNWNSICITFSERPEFHHLPETLTLIEKVDSLRKMHWGMNTDIHKVFQLILNFGVGQKLTQDQMPQVLLIYTDMEFDQAISNPEKTNFEAAKSEFQEKGFTLPTIVFWNLRANKGTTSTPVQMNEQGALLLSGFSAQQLAYVMEQDDISKCTPLQFVLDVIENKKYSNLIVHD